MANTVAQICATVCGGGDIRQMTALHLIDHKLATCR